MATSGEICFDGWTYCPSTGELTRAGTRIRLQLLPARVMEELLARPGQLITRKELAAALWPRGVVDFDAGLNSAVRKLRSALDDDPETHRYIETLPRRGYRFVGTLRSPGDPGRMPGPIGPAPPT